MNKLVPLYTIWPGRNRFCCRGALLTGPVEDCGTNLYTWGCVCGVGIPYIILVTPILWTQISPALSIITYFLFFSTILFLFLTQCSDPGIVPRFEIIRLLNDPKLVVEYIQEEYINPQIIQNHDQEFLSNNNLKPIETQPVQVIQIQPMQVRICTTCNVKRPPRSAHCGSCGNCVLVHDHHCPFVNNCIGKNNYRFFMSFIISVSALSVSVVTGMICFLVIIASKNLNNDSKSTILIIFIIPIGISGLCVFSLCFYHFYLRCIGKTTREDLKNQNKAESDESNQFLWFSGSQTLFDPRQLVYVNIDSHD